MLTLAFAGALTVAVPLLVIPPLFAGGERGGDDCAREYEERFGGYRSVTVEGWSWRPYGVRCAITRQDGTTVRVVAHPYW